MALAYALGARIWQTSTTQTTGGTITLSAAAQTIIVDGVTHVYRRFRDEFADGAKVALYLGVESSGEYEYSYGTLVYGTPDSVQSRTVTRSDGGIGVPKAWGAGTRNALCAADPLELLLRTNLLEEIALLGSSQQGTARTNLGLGTAAVLSQNQVGFISSSTLTGGSSFKVVRYTSSGTVTDASQADTIAQLLVTLFKAPDGSGYYAAGSLVTGLSGLTSGQAYWLGTAGGLVTSPPTPSSTVRQLFIGQALSTTMLLFQPGIPIGG